MNKQELQAKADSMQKELDELKALIDKPEVSVRKRVAEGDDYWCTDVCGAVVLLADTCHEVDDANFTFGNYFYTKEDALKARERQLAYVRIVDALAEHSKGWKPDWSDRKQQKFFIYISYRDGVFGPMSDSYAKTQQNELYGTKEACQWVIDNMEDDLNIWFEV